MTSPRFAVALYVAGTAVALGAFAYLLDHARATAHVVRGLGEAAEPEREQELAVPEATGDVFVSADEEAELESARTAPRARVSEREGLVIRVVDEEGRKLFFVDVLVYRGGELLRAGRGMGNSVTLIPFDGPASVRAEHNGFEIARSEIPEGRGEYELVVPPLPSVAGVVRVGGVPRRGIALALTTGGDGWLDGWVAFGLETVGLRQRTGSFGCRTKADGTFCYEDLAPGWSGVLSLGDPQDYRLVHGARRIELARPEDGLVLELEPLRPEVELRGRVVFAGEPVPGASWSLEDSSNWDRCDELGRFSIHVFADELAASRLRLSRDDLGERTVAVGPASPRDLGDVELLPYRRVRFVVRSESGSPIAGARAVAGSRSMTDFERFKSLGSASDPTDAAGESVLEWLSPDENEMRVSARGYAPAFVAMSEGTPEPIPVVLTRCAAVHVVVRDRAGRTPPGVCVRIESVGQPFSWDDGEQSWGDGMLLDRASGNTIPSDSGFTKDCFTDARGRAWIDPLRSGAAFDLSAVDAYGTVLATAPGLVLAPGEWRRIDLLVEAEPRTLLVHVRDTLGQKLAYAGLEVMPAGVTAQRPQFLRTDRAGMVRIQPLYASDVTLRVSRRGFESRTLEHLALPPEGATVHVRLAHDWWSW